MAIKIFCNFNPWPRAQARYDHGYLNLRHFVAERKKAIDGKWGCALWQNAGNRFFAGQVRRGRYIEGIDHIKPLFRGAFIRAVALECWARGFCSMALNEEDFHEIAKSRLEEIIGHAAQQERSSAALGE